MDKMKQCLMKLYNPKTHDKAWIMTSASNVSNPHPFFKKQGLIKVPNGSRLIDYRQEEATVMALDVTRTNGGKTSAKSNNDRDLEETKSYLPISEANDDMSSSGQTEMSMTTTKTHGRDLNKHCILGDCNGNHM